MEKQKITIGGINRGIPQVGDCHELINLRKDLGLWRGVKEKTTIKALNLNYSVLHVHQSDTKKNTVGYCSENGKLYRISTDKELFLHNIGKNLNIKMAGVGRVLIVSDNTNYNTHYFLYDALDDSYNYIDSPTPPAIVVNLLTSLPDINNVMNHAQGSVLLDGTDFKGRQQQVQAIVAKRYREWKESGYFNGFVVYRAAFEMYDGEIVSYSPPALFCNTVMLDPSGEYPFVDMLTQITNNGKSVTVTSPFYGRRVAFQVNPSYADVINEIKSKYDKLVRSFNIYMSKPVDRFPVDLIGITVEGEQGDYYYRLYENEVLGSPEKLISEQILYKVASVPIDKLDDSFTDYTELKINLNDLHTEEHMPSEELTAHRIHGRYVLTYNSMLWLVNITTKLCDGIPKGSLFFVEPDEPTGETNEIVFEFILKTGLGTAGVRSLPVSTEAIKFFLPFVLCYPDSRAYEFRILIKPHGYEDFYVCLSLDLVAHNTNNLAYGFLGERTRENDILTMSKHLSRQFEWEIPTNFDDFIVAGDPFPNTLSDINRVQATKVNNPFFFPSKHSYQVGTGNLIGLGINTTPLSDLQFGQHPLLAFSDSGIWAMELSVGDVLVTRVFPLSDDICNNADSICSIGNMVFFATNKGLYAITGRECRLASSSLNNGFNRPLYKDNTASIYERAVNDAFSSLSVLSDTPFEDYILGAKLCIDFLHNELIVSNTDYDYSYIFNSSEKVWSKRSESFKLFGTSWPNSVAINAANKLVDINNETGECLPVMIETRDIDMGAYCNVDRMAFRADMKSDNDNDIVFALYGSGRKDANKYILNAKSVKNIEDDSIVSSRSLRSARFLRFLFIGKLSDICLGAIHFNYTGKWKSI